MRAHDHAVDFPGQPIGFPVDCVFVRFVDAARHIFAVKVLAIFLDPLVKNIGLGGSVFMADKLSKDARLTGHGNPMGNYLPVDFVLSLRHGDEGGHCTRKRNGAHAGSDSTVQHVAQG